MDTSLGRARRLLCLSYGGILSFRLKGDRKSPNEVKKGYYQPGCFFVKALDLYESLGNVMTKFRFPFFYFFITLYPLLSLWAVNVTEIWHRDVLRATLVTLIVALLFYLLLWLILRRTSKAALLGGFYAALFFSYGHIYDLVRHADVVASLGRHRYLAPVFLLLGISGTFLILRARKTTWMRWLNLASVILVILPVSQIGYFYLSSAQASSHLAASSLRETSPGVPPGPLPDVYLIVLDTYMRADAMQQDLGFDNSPFIQELEALGFYVADCSRSNYSYTLGSLAAVLNMDYIPALKEKHKDIAPGAFWSIIKHSEVRQRLESMGYETVAFRTSYAWSELTDAALFLGLDQPVLRWQSLSPFERMYLNTTALRVVGDFLYKAETAPYIADAGESRGLPPDFSYHVSLQRFILAQLPKIPDRDGPKFVFVHILVPHPPYVFAPDGSILEDPGFYSGERADAINDRYRAQGYIGVQFINNHILPVLEEIIRRSSMPPIIILQGDHGFRDTNRLTILNAYYLPNGSQSLYETVTPVNSFRIVFNEYFGGQFPLLPDMSYNGKEELIPETYPSCLP